MLKPLILTVLLIIALTLACGGEAQPTVTSTVTDPPTPSATHTPTITPTATPDNLALLGQMRDGLDDLRNTPVPIPVQGSPTPTPPPSKYRLDAAEVANVGTGAVVYPVLISVTVTRILGNHESDESVLMWVNGNGPIPIRQLSRHISSLKEGEQGSYIFSYDLKRGNHRVLLEVGDSNKVFTVAVPAPTPTRIPTPTPTLEVYIHTPTPIRIRTVVRTPVRLPVAIHNPTPTPTIVVPRIVTPTLPTLPQFTPAPLPQPRVNPIPTPTPLIPVAATSDLTPLPSQTPASLDSAKEEARLAGSGVMNAVATTLLEQQPSLNYRFEITIDSGSETSHGVIDYDNMLQGEELWKASGELTSHPSGTRVIFDSRYSSSCLKLTQPEEGTWVYHEHEGWATHENPDVFTPILPMTFLRVQPTPEWEVIASTDAGVVLSHEPLDNGLTITLHVDRESFVVREEVTVVGGTLNIAADYNRYGQVAPLEVHKSREDCKARN